MIYYAHRGNVDGPKREENEPNYVDHALSIGFHAEVDLWLLGADFYLGHNYPRHRVSYDWIESRKSGLLLHIKDVPALNTLYETKSDWHFFCHKNDPFVLTSHGCVWLHEITSQPPVRKTIVPLISRDAVTSYPHTEFYGVCSDYTHCCKEKFQA